MPELDKSNSAPNALMTLRLSLPPLNSMINPAMARNAPKAIMASFSVSDMKSLVSVRDARLKRSRLGGWAATKRSLTRRAYSLDGAKVLLLAKPP